MLNFLKVISLAFIITFSFQVNAQDFKILVFTKTEGYKHQSITHGIEMLEKLGAENDFDVFTTQDSSLFTTKNLKQYSAVVFLSTTGDVLNPILNMIGHGMAI